MNKNKPLLIALDMDGTLLTYKKTISLKTLFYLRKLTKQGHKIVLASGRPVRSLKEYYKKLKLKTPLICYNGAYSFSPYDSNFKKDEHKFKKETILDLLKSLKDVVEGVMCETDDEIWVDKEDKKLATYFWYKDTELHVGDLNKNLNKDTRTCIIKMEQTDKNKKLVKKFLSKYPGLGCLYWTGAPYFELHYDHTSKGDALKRIAQYYKIPRENVIAFGDSDNDQEMFRFAGTSVLMCTRKEDVPGATMESIKGNNDNGIYYTLKKLLK